MPFTVGFVELVDIPIITTIQWSALRDNPLIQSIYPRGLTQELESFTATSYERAATYPSVRIVKAIDDETGQIVAFAKWIMFRQDQQENEQTNLVHAAGQGVQGGEGEGGWGKGWTSPLQPPHCYTRVLENWNRRITGMRKGIMGRKRHSCLSAPKHSLSCYFACFSKELCVLEILHTHPSQQGKGAGTELVKWGTEIADKRGMHCYVETPVAGYSLFRQSGFQNVTEMSMDLGQYKDGFMEYKHVVMVRSPFGTMQPERPPPVPPKNTKEHHQQDLAERESLWDTVSEVEDDESPTLQYTAEARILDLRSSSSTGSPRLGSVAAMRATTSMRDLRSSTSTESRVGSILDVRTSSSMGDVRTSSSMGDVRTSLYQPPASVQNARASMRDMGYSFSTRDLRRSASTGSALS